MNVLAEGAGDPGTNCYSRPHPDERALHPSPEGQFGGQSIGYLPLGMGCTWTLADGTLYFQPTPNLLPSVLVYGGLGAGVVGVVGLRGRRAGHPAVPPGTAS